ncbi:NEW3 domain-containing protein [Parafilimonas sp.]|uniref:COG1470 family protein n=1 Tax=Parafilimonas sp. TaxID=1969739 RepID=UPI0039E616CA
MSAKSTIIMRRMGRLFRLQAVFILSVCLFRALPAAAQTAAAAGANAPSAFTSNLINVEAAVNETFRYNASLHNGSSQQLIYDLHTQAPAGWNIVFRASGSQVSSISVDAGKTQNISIEINAAENTSPAKYNIPVMAISAKDTLRLNLQAVVKGSYGIQLSTPTGLLSGDITEGSQKQIQLVVKNTGSLPLSNVELSAQTPSKWEATFEPAKIQQLDAGKTADVTATLKVPDKTITGDYVTSFTARNTNGHSDAAFRMTVKTSIISGWIGILVILLAIYLVYRLIRKYGRR